ncbi:unnamed protein product [Camellia sinensis]
MISQFIFDAAAEFCVDIATHQHGCCVLNRCIDKSVGKYQEKLVAAIAAYGLLLAQDAFGNYVVQYVIQEIPLAAAGLISQFEGHYVHLSMQKFSSHVVEKCLKHFEESRPRIIHELLSVPHFEQLLQDPFANYVIQSALEVSKEQYWAPPNFRRSLSVKLKFLAASRKLIKIGPNVSISANVRIAAGENAVVMHAIVGRKSSIGKWSRAQYYNAKLGITILGEAVTVEDKVVVTKSIVLPNKTLNVSVQEDIILCSKKSHSKSISSLLLKYSICWNKSGLHEVILGTTGRKQGTSAKGAIYPSTESSLCN